MVSYQGVTFLFFQCQLAVEGGIVEVAAMIEDVLRESDSEE